MLTGRRGKNGHKFDWNSIVRSINRFTFRISGWIHCKKEETDAGFFYRAGGCDFDLFYPFIYS